MQRVEKLIRSIVTNAEEPKAEGLLTFENLGSVLHKLGIFQNLEFNKEDRLNQSSLTINQAKIKPERLGSEV